jgi:hypothetical protein
MNLDEYLAISGPKYVVISRDAFAAQEVAQQLAPEPGSFVFNQVEYVAINVEPVALPDLVAYIEQQQAGIEFEFTQGSGLVSLLTHAQVLDLKSMEIKNE